MTRKLTFLILALFALISGPGWGQKITSYNNLVSGKQYYIGATVSGTDYYFYTDPSTIGEGIQGTSKTDKADASILTVAGSGTSWSFQFSNGNYLSLKNGKDNGKVKIVATQEQWTLSNVSSLINMKINNYCLMKNSGTSLNFGSYSSGQTNVWFEEVISGNTPSITAIDNVTLDYDATEGQFNYSISNPTTGVNMTASTEDSWISNIIVNESNVTFTTTENETSAQRVGTITLSYTGATSKAVTVTQAAAPAQGENYTLFSGDLVEGDYIIVYNNGAMGNEVSSNRLSIVDVTPVENVISTDNNDIVWQIAQNSDGYWTLYNAEAGKYAASTGTKNQITLSEDATDNKSQWTSTGNDSYEFINKNNAASNVNANLRRNGTFGFACYGTGTGGALTLYKKDGDTPSVATPTFTPAAGTYTEAQNVTIACTTEGAAIYYTLDGSTPTNASTLYTSAIAVNETTTIKAIAYLNDEASSVASATYTINIPVTLTTMDEIFAKATAVGTTATDVYVIFNNWVITGVKGSNAYLTDNAGKGLIIYTSNHGFAVGDVLNGTIACQIKLYSGASELMGVTSETSGLTVTKNGEITIHEVSIADLSGVNTGAVIKVNNVQYNGTNLVDENSNIIKPYNAVDYNPTFTNGLKYNVTGVYIQFNTTKEIAPRNEDDIYLIPDTEYAINLHPNEHGTISADLETASAGQIVTLTAIPNEHYHFVEWTVLDGEAEEVTVTNNQFTMPASDVEVEATFAENETYIITYYYNGEPYTEDIIEEGAIGALEIPSDDFLPEGFTFAGWSTSMASTTAITESYNVTANTNLFAIFAREEGGTTGSGNYEKVTSALTDWRGDYLIAYSDEVFMNGSLAGGKDGVGAANSSVAPETALTANTITAAWGDQYYVTIEAIDDNDLSKGYVIKSHSETTPYFYQTSNTNGMANTNNKTTAAAYPINIVFNNENDIDIALGGAAIGAVLHYNATGTGHMFRFYKNGAQENIYLYKKAAGTPGTTHYYTRVYDEDTELATLTVAGPSIILSDYTLTVTGAMSNENPANLVIEDGAQLFQNSSNVMATFQKNITGYTGDNDNYYLIAAPIADASIEGLTTNEYDLFSYDEPTHYWFNQKGTDNPFNTLSLGQGYLYANSTTGNVTISGIISNEQDPTIAVTASASNLTGFNLVGNPFTYNLNIGNMAMMDNTDIYYITSIYQIVGTAIVVSQNTSIAPCEGFFIQAPAAGELFFNAESSRSEKSPVSDLKVEVKEATRSAQLIDRAYVNFSESRPMNKFYLNENSTRLYIPQNGEDYAVVMASAAEGELPMNFKAEKNGSYTITVDTENVDAEYLHLIDNMTGMDVDLLSTPSYTFEAKTSDYASRFKLVFGVNNTASESSDSNFAYMSDGNLVINNIEGEATLQIVDELGRVISTETVSGSYSKALNLKAGLYIINLNGMTQKIVVK